MTSSALGIREKKFCMGMDEYGTTRQDNPTLEWVVNGAECYDSLTIHTHMHLFAGALAEGATEDPFCGRVGILGQPTEPPLKVMMGSWKKNDQRKEGVCEQQAQTCSQKNRIK